MAARAIFSTGEMTRLGNWATRHILVDTCLILREARSLSPSGATVSTWPATTGTNRIPCALLDEDNPQEQITAAEQTGVIRKLLLLPLGTDILKIDRVEVGGFVYHVIDLYDPSTYKVVMRVLVKRLLSP